MDKITALMRSSNVNSVIVVDDAYEVLPIARDLLKDGDKWEQFFEDLNADDRSKVSEIFPKFSEMRADKLREDDAFITALWNQSHKLRREIIDPLFERFKGDKAHDLAYLKTITDQLETLGIRYKKAGREFEDAALNADLIIIDLFLGASEDEVDMDLSISGLYRVIHKRLNNPPLVILMSRSSRLEEKRKQFRDKSGLFESEFRIIRKTDLAAEGKLARLLAILAEHYKDSLKLVRFVNAWQNGLNMASERTAALIRSLDLADHAQIQQLLLAEEGQPTGSYLVDVFDRVLQHEMERDDSIINSAIELNSLSSDTYPPPYVAGSPSLQSLVYRCLFQNVERLRLSGSVAWPISFGDVLQRKQIVANGAQNESNPSLPLSFLGPLNVLVVLTPACDLQQDSTKSALVMKGSLISLNVENWTYEEKPIRTHVFETRDSNHFQIKWDLKHIETISKEAIGRMLDAPDGWQIIARMRDSHALELQQKLLSNLGRVGALAPMPATFAVRVQAYYPAPDSKLIKLNIPECDENVAVWFVGRKNNKSAAVLVLCEDACEGICAAIESIDLLSVHSNTRETITTIRENGDMLILRHGIDCTGLSQSGFKEIAFTALAVGDQRPVKRVFGLIRHSGPWLEEVLNGSHLKKAGIILAVTV